MKILELTFESAQALFHDYVSWDQVTKNFQNYKATVKPRMKSKTYIPHNKKFDSEVDDRYNPYIDTHTLANILSVLTNIPTVSRLDLYKKRRELNEECLNYAKKAYIEITKKSADMSFFSHKFNLNCWSKTGVFFDDGVAIVGGILCWERIEHYLSEDFPIFTAFVEKVLGVDSYKALSFNDVVNSIRTKKNLKCVQEMVAYLIGKKKKALSNLLSEDPIKNTHFNQHHSIRVMRKIRGGIHKEVHSIDGTIKIPVEDSFVKLLTNGPGDATILEGGLIYISKISPYKSIPESNVFCGEPKKFFKGK